jgi:hypothetical protein
MSWALRGIVINEFSSPDYEFDTCTKLEEGVCVKTESFGAVVLTSRGLQTDYIWVWYGLVAITGMYFVFLVITAVMMKYMRNQVTPAPSAKLIAMGELTDATTGAKATDPTKEDDAKPEGEGEGADPDGAQETDDVDPDGNNSPDSPDIGPDAGLGSGVDIPFEPVDFAFKDLWYTVQLPSGEELVRA